MVDATRVHHTQADFDNNVNILLRQGYRVQSNDGKRAVMFKEPGYGHPLLHIAMLFLVPIVGNIIVAWLARCGTGRSVAVELREPIGGQVARPTSTNPPPADYGTNKEFQR